MLVANQRIRLFGTAGQDWFWLAALAVSYVVTLAASWQRWSDPVVDVGREMNQPLRLAGGEMLYSDVRHVYGPLSPWFHAALFHLFKPSLTLLYADGIVTAAIALALVYWLGRQIMSPAATGAASLNVLSFCVFKPAGNYILPYSYNSLHGTVLGLITLAILVAALKSEERSASVTVPRASSRRRTSMFLLAGLVAGLATLAKTEMGAAAVTGGVTAAVLVSYPDRRRAVRLGLIFVLPAAALTTAVYTLIAAHVGWSTLAFDSWLLIYTIPPEVAHFNAELSGFAHPLTSLGRMLIALAKLGMLAACIAAISTIIATSAARERRASDPPSRQGAVVSHPWRVLVGVAALLMLMAVTTGIDRDKGPYLAIPFVLGGMLVMLLSSLRRAANTHTATLIVLTVYAIASLARIILHVRSGGAYASYLLPVAVVLFTYLWVGPLPNSLRDAHVSRVARSICLALLVLAALLNMVGLAYRYRTRNTVPITTARGTMIAGRDIALAFNEGLAYIDRHTTVGDGVAVIPEGTSINFLSGRRNPLREEILTPGYLDVEGEIRAIGQLRDAHTALILIPNRPTREFGPAVFGRDYYQRLGRWIEEHYRICAIFGPVNDAGLEIGDKPYFIRAYCLR